ncbi:hypothetical protein LCGC14_2790220 [marine sediment metagenome]|uniref:Essential protein Yae1 N-terminal domain-containing protein n=1 Tax=marine sediment metagenome TaxID=412755 RepID=A0A0F9AZD2_9ZZZZ
MINEIFISKWDPVVPIPCMTPAQLDNELERILAGFRHGEELDRALEQGRDEGYEDGFNDGYTQGHDDAER